MTMTLQSPAEQWAEYLRQSGMAPSAATDAEFRRLYPNQGTAPQPAGGVQPSPTTQPAGGTQTPQQAVNVAAQSVITAQGGVQPVQARQIEASRSSVAAATSAQGAVKTALGASSAALDVQELGVQQAESERVAILAASKNTANLVDVALKRRAQTALDYLHERHGIPMPDEVVLPEGEEAPTGGVAPGIRYRIQTEEEKLRAKSAENAGARQTQLELARITATRAGDVAEVARIDAQLEALKAQAAGLDVQAAQLGVEGVKLGLDQARLNLDISNTPPFEGAVKNRYTGQWQTASEVDKDYAARDVVKDPTDPTGGTFVTRSELAARTNPDGTIRNAQGVNVDPNTGNQWTQQGDGSWKWVDPKTGNVFGDDGIWRNPQGFLLIGANASGTGGQWVPPDHSYSQADGGWWSEDGYQLGDDGIWRRAVIDARGFFQGYVYRRWDGRQWINWSNVSGAGGGPTSAE